MSHPEPENMPENKDLWLWLSIDEEGIELAKRYQGSDFVEKNQEIISKERKIEKFISNNLKGEEKCPEELLNNALSRIQKEDSSLLQKVYPFPLSKKSKILLPLCAMVVICISTFLFISLFPSTMKNTHQKEAPIPIATSHSLNKNIEKNKDNEQQKPQSPNILLSSFERNLTNSDSETIQNRINSKISNISVNLKDFLDTNNDYQLIGYVEDELEGKQVIQIIFDYKGNIVKMVVLPFSTTTIDLIKPAIESGEIRDIKRIDNYFISIIGEDNESNDLFQFITSNKDIISNSDDVINTINSDENTSDSNYSENQTINMEGALSNETVSSDIYDTSTNDTSPI